MGKVFGFSIAMIDQLNLEAVVEEGQFTNTLGQDVEVEFNIAENLIVG